MSSLTDQLADEFTKTIFSTQFTGFKHKLMEENLSTLRFEGIL